MKKSKSRFIDGQAVATQTEVQGGQSLSSLFPLYELPSADEGAEPETALEEPQDPGLQDPGLQDVDPDTGRMYVGLAGLPRQVHQSCVAKGFDLTLMVVGESGMGKSTLVNSLFLVDLYKDRLLPSASENVTQTMSITRKTAAIEEKGIRLSLTVVDTPGFGAALDNRESRMQASDYIKEQFEAYRRDETALNRRNIQDNRVHCCLYFISPFGHGLKPLDVACMRSLQDLVNLVPVVAKADSLTKAELQVKKARILKDIASHKIKIFQFLCEEEDEFWPSDLELQNSIPFAVIGGNATMESNDKCYLARVYPWGAVNVESPANSDFSLLRRMLVTNHMQAMKDFTHHTLYENYRVKVHQRSHKPTRRPIANKDQCNTYAYIRHYV